ncbi:hypothetical protein LTR08_002487 [Meristemomyces frigidus]|nr:hypothetical protein LTR08_002487 [Meristemomyces frigidus]
MSASQLPPDVPATALPVAAPPPNAVLQPTPPNAGRQAQAWRDAMVQAYQAPHITLRLAERIVDADRQDTRLHGSVSYRSLVGQKDLEHTAHILHLLSQEVKLALLACDYKQLVTLQSLPPQLTEVLPDYATHHNDSDKDKQRPAIYMHFHVDDRGVPPTTDEYRQVADAVQKYFNCATALNGSAAPTVADRTTVDQIDQTVQVPRVGRGRGDYNTQKKELRYGQSAVFRTGLSQ